MRRLAREVAGFGAVGVVGLAAQLVVFNLLVARHVGPLTSNAVAVVVSVTVAYLGNRYLAFGTRRSARPVREAVLFVAVNLVTLALAEGILSLGYLTGSEHDPVVLNTLTIVGIAIGTVIRFVAYRSLVFVALGGGSGSAVSVADSPDVLHVHRVPVVR